MALLPLTRSEEGSRSTALSTLLVALASLLTGQATAVRFDANEWIQIFLAALIALDFAAFLFAYIYLLINDRDALRSERFALSKMAMEKSLTGDSLSGFDMANEKTKPRPGSAPSEPEGETE